MQSFIPQAQVYATYHQNPITRYIHMLGVPLITLSLMILFGFIRIVILGVMNISFANILGLALIVYYFILEWRLALAITPIFVFLLWVASLFNYNGPTAFALWSFGIIFVLGIIIQFIGHIIEGKKPAFVENLWQILIAPLFLMADVFFMLGKMQTMKSEIYIPAIHDEHEI